MLFLNKIILIFSSALLLMGCASIERLAIPASQLNSTQLNQTGDIEKIDHTEWSKFLTHYTSTDNQGVTRVSYATVSDADHQNLKNYIQRLTNLNAQNFSRNAQLAYWVNLYNAQTVNVILGHYPVDSIRNIKDSFFDLGPWDNKNLIVNGQALSLHDIEHGIIRPLWSDTPEIHYLVNCAAAGCPNLSTKPYTAETITGDMKRASIAFINNQRGVTVFDDGTIGLSKIYSWYLDDFGGSEKAILDHIKQYADADLKEILSTRPKVQQYFYDWELNDTRFSNQLKTPKLTNTLSYN